MELDSFVSKSNNLYLLKLLERGFYSIILNNAEVISFKNKKAAFHCFENLRITAG